MLEWHLYKIIESYNCSVFETKLSYKAGKLIKHSIFNQTMICCETVNHFYKYRWKT